MRVIYFDLDCIRDDHLGCYGYHRDTSPNIDRLAQDSVSFTRCYTTNSPCVPSRAALFSGRFGISNGVAGNTDKPIQFPGCRGVARRRERMPMVMRHLYANGAKPVSFSNFADRHRTWWFHAGWHEHHLVNLRCGFETADEVNAVLLPWLEDHCTDDDYLLHVHYWDIHFPYRCPDMPKWMDIFKDDPLPPWPDAETIARQHETIYGSRTASSLWGRPNEWQERCPWMPSEIANTDDFRALIDGYDGAIRFVDHYIGQVLEVLAKKGVLDDVVIIIGGDHGDNFGEGGGHYMDHTLGSEPVLRRPLIVRWPGVTKQGTCDELTYLLDLAPTFCEMFDAPVPEGWDGASLMPAIRGEEFTGRDYLVCDHGMASVQRSVRTRDHLYVRTLHPGAFPIDEPQWLFNMNADPNQINNIAAEKPDVVEQHESMISEWRQDQIDKHGLENDPMVEMARAAMRRPPERMAERLRADGQDKRAEEILARHEVFKEALKDT
jgi:arylsulfatase A-like enzyme